MILQSFITLDMIIWILWLFLDRSALYAAQGHARSYKATYGREKIKQLLCHFELATLCSIWSKFHFELFCSICNKLFANFFVPFGTFFVRYEPFFAHYFSPTTTRTTTELLLGPLRIARGKKRTNNLKLLRSMLGCSNVSLLLATIRD